MSYSIIIPVYNSEDILEQTVSTTIETLQGQNLDFEIILINDGSKDNSWLICEELARDHDMVKAVNMLKNYGQHTAVFCGIANSSKEFMITMDDDLQNPPSEIIKLINKINEGYDVVFAQFRQKMHRSHRKLGSKLVNYLNKKIFDKPSGIVLSNFRIFSREVAERILKYKTYYPYIPGLLLMFSSKIANVETEHHERKAGKSNYSLFKILKLVGRLLFNYSSYPLKILTTIGFVIALVSFAVGLFYVVYELVFGIDVPGWTTIVALLSFFNGFLIIMLGVLGEYIARIMKQVSIDQPYQIKKVIS